MAARRAAGEPLQYVFGHWQFRSLDLLVDRRVLIPRPETEQVVEVALAEAHRLGRHSGGSPDEGLVVVDAGTGSGAIALALAAELGHPAVREVWATDTSAEALEVAAANLRARRTAGGDELPRRGARAGSWLEALPASLRGAIDLIVSNPPYVAESEWAGLAAEVHAEPWRALVAGPASDGTAGLADVEAVLVQSRAWLARPGPRSWSWRPTRPVPVWGWPGGWGSTTCGSSPTWRVGPGRSWRAWRGHRTDMTNDRGDERGDDMDAKRDHPPLSSPSDTAVAAALRAGLIIAVPAVGGYSLAMRAGPPETEARLVELAADPEGPHYAVGYAEALRSLTSGWSDELGQLLERCWPGPVEVFVPRGFAAGEATSGAHAERLGRCCVGRLGRGGGHARRPRAAQAVPGARSLAHRAAQLHRCQGGRQGLRRRRRGARRRRRPARRPASHAGRRDRVADPRAAGGRVAVQFRRGDHADEHAATLVLPVEEEARTGLSPAPGRQGDGGAAARSTAGRVLTERRASQWLRRPRAAKCAGRSVSAYVASHSRLRCRL